MRMCASRTCRRHAISANTFAGACGLARAHGSYGLCSRPTVDVVYIATPHTLHAKTLCFACVQANMSCEKPFALNTAQLTEMVNEVSGAFF